MFGRSNPRVGDHHRVVPIACLLCVFVCCAALAQLKRNETMDETFGGTLAPKITEAWIAFYITDVWTDPPIPFDNTHLSIKLVVKAIFQGQTHLYAGITAAENAVLWSVYGVDGATEAAPLSYPTVQSVTNISTIEPWPSFFKHFPATQDDIANAIKLGQPTVTWYIHNQKCIAYRKASDRKYSYNDVSADNSWLINNIWGNDTTSLLVPGLVRMRAVVDYKGRSIETPKYEYSTRFLVRTHNSFCSNERRNKYIQYLHMYLNEPYEFGGKSVGGKICLRWDTYAGIDAKGNKYYTDDKHGTDCSGLVAKGAKWAGYNWPLGQNYGTGNIPNVSGTTFPPSDPFGPGDILNKVQDHVVTVTMLDGDSFDLIEAIGGNTSIVRSSQSESLAAYIANGYVKRRLEVQ